MRATVDAFHRVLLRDEHIQFYEPLRGQQQCRIEIQVVSLLRHAWAEVEHDLVYKQAARTSPAECRALDRPSGAIIMGERFLDRLYSPDNALPVTRGCFRDRLPGWMHGLPAGVGTGSREREGVGGDAQDHARFLKDSSAGETEDSTALVVHSICTP